MMAIPSQCSLELLKDSSSHLLIKPSTHIINNDCLSYSINPMIESIIDSSNIDQLTIKSINHHHHHHHNDKSISSNSTNDCPIETQLYNEEEKILTQCLIHDNTNNTTNINNNTTNNSNQLLNDDLLLNDLYYDHNLLHNPYLYHTYYDIDYDLTGITPFNHSSLMNNPGLTRSTRKIDNDPTILLTLLKWARIGSNQFHGDDDLIDRMNYQYTSVLLLILLTLTGFRQYLSHLPLQCWIPQEFSRSWEEYAEHYCWVTNTYFTNVQSAIPPVNNRTTVVRYYQWATFVFILQAAGFFLPCLIWRLLQNHSGFHVQRIMRSAIRLNCAETDSSQLITYGLARYIDSVIYHRSYKQWRVHSPKIKSHFKHKSPQNNSMIKSTQKSTSHTSSSTTLTSTSHDIGTETKFVKFDNESLPTKQTSNPCKTLPNESMVSRSYKKQPAPQPPVTTTNSTTTTTTSTTTITTTTTSTNTTSTTTVITTNTTTTTTAVMVTTKNSLKVNSDQIIYTSSPILKSTSNVIQSKLNSLSSKQNDHRKFYSPICNTCRLCFNNLSIIDRKIKTKSIQSLVTTSTITEISPPPPPPPSSSSSSLLPTTTTTPTELTTGAILFNSKNNSKLQSTQSALNPSQQKSSSSSSYYNQQQSMKSNKQSLLHNYKSKSKIFSIKNTCYQLIYNLWLFLRCFLTLLCLLPTCLFHWLLCGNGVSGGGGGGSVGNQKIKRIQRSHSFLFYLYVTIKLLYLINIIGQIYLMQIFLGVKSYFFGIYVLKDLIYGNIWSETGHFPRVTYCDFEAKKLGKNYKYTLQCVLPLNLFLEKVYVFLWFWYLFIGLLTFYSLIKWLLRLTLSKKRIKFIKKFLYSYQSINQSINQSTDLNQFKLFINQYLNLDGIFLLWLLSMNMNDIMMNDLIRTLWNLFLTRLYTIQSITLSKINNPLIDSMNDDQKKFSYLYQSINRNQSNVLLKSIINEQNDHNNNNNNNNQLFNDHFMTSLKKYPITKNYSKSFLYNHDHIDPIFYLNYNHNDPFIYSKQFHSCCQPVTKYGETMNVTTNNSNNMNICHSTDIFESSDSIV
ncbi:unnamed protein product [Schistosoma haematobium]|nr:unnamed protein product [Schistosoma haematobium]